MASRTKIPAGGLILESHAFALPDGQKLQVEVMQTDSDSHITGQFLLESKGNPVPLGSIYCGTCGDRSVGCVYCRIGSPIIDLVNNCIYCVS